MNFNLSDNNEFNIMLKNAIAINKCNVILKKILPSPLNTLSLVQIIDNTAIFVAKNQTILTLAKEQKQMILSYINKELKLVINNITLKIVS